MYRLGKHFYKILFYADDVENSLNINITNCFYEHFFVILRLEEATKFFCNTVCLNCISRSQNVHLVSRKHF